MQEVFVLTDDNAAIVTSVLTKGGVTSLGKPSVKDMLAIETFPTQIQG